MQFDLPRFDTDVAVARVESTAAAESLVMPYTEQERLRRDRANLIAALRLTKGKISGAGGAAELLGIKPTTLASRMKALDIKPPARSHPG